MHLSVIDINPDVTCKRTCKRTFAHLVVDTLENRRHKAGVNRTTDNAVHKLELSAPRKVKLLLALDVEHHLTSVNLELVGHLLTLHDWADEQMNLTELACSAGLFLVAVGSGRNLSDGLAVGNPRREHLDFNLVLVAESPLDDVDVLLALSLEDGLFHLL